MPVAYQRDAGGETVAIDARFVQTASDELQFAIGRYDRSRPLVIDPVYEYSTYLGGGGSSSALLLLALATFLACRAINRRYRLPLWRGDDDEPKTASAPSAPDR